MPSVIFYTKSRLHFFYEWFKKFSEVYEFQENSWISWICDLWNSCGTDWLESGNRDSGNCLIPYLALSSSSSIHCMNVNFWQWRKERKRRLRHLTFGQGDNGVNKMARYSELWVDSNKSKGKQNIIKYSHKE